MNYGEIKKNDIANGEGVRVSLFVSGCRHHCHNCFNPETWSFNYGKAFTQDTEREIIDALGRSYINGLTILGGEPFEPENQRALLPFLERVRAACPDKTIWCYTGCIFEELACEMPGENLCAEDTCTEGISTENICASESNTNNGHNNGRICNYRFNYRCEVTDRLLRLIDVLVDGPFIEELKDITLRFRGSSNQRIIDLRLSMSDSSDRDNRENKAVLFMD